MLSLHLRDDDDINDVASMAGVNLNEESARILATSSELVGTKIRSCKDESFLPAGLLHRRILDTGTLTCLRTLLKTGWRGAEGFPPIGSAPSLRTRPAAAQNLPLPLPLLPSAKKLGVTEVPLEVVNFISHATQSRLRSLLEKVSAVAQHRTDGGKVRMAHSQPFCPTRGPSARKGI